MYIIPFISFYFDCEANALESQNASVHIYWFEEWAVYYRHRRRYKAASAVVVAAAANSSIQPIWQLQYNLIWTDSDHLVVGIS